ncbi:hypothetical protein KAM429_17670 [Aquipseudomonas alcaligenes]|uniref:Uncharacterized protein n=1 Tax=Aquipseudomonas alcaligenes TaxID=43263 RepID=A0AA37CFT0_AQUAC|nr:hypothetical protein KAM426_04070 [Pseudomonas alcaligenes]GIZ67331.1 hypothetical protein KAM428_24160 [Pseudomonas alcaligenes]GIZ71006.1 hypothetical protein KAM429_17670 [Pseudomonas alcaligenes]GIZ75353.1 hypothetical protein KAM430_17620 [Pseudomonas alcaligenes]GIZ80088.1 hypothetical protein KAM432_21360 [Pseudomonas alcaligenes]
MQHFADFAHGRHEIALAHAKTDATPGLYRLLLRRQTGSQRTATLIESNEKLEGRLRVRHADLGLFFLCGYGLARR